MAKISFTKLGLKINQDIKNIEFNEQIIEVKQYLPVNMKLELISNVINRILLENNNFINPIKIEVFTVIEILYYYTNINFTEKQKEDIPKLYDLVVSSGLWEQIVEAMLEEEFDFVVDGVIKSIKELENRSLVFPDEESKKIFKLYLTQYGYFSFVKKMSHDLMYSDIEQKIFKKEFTSNNLRYLLLSKPILFI